MRVYIFPLQATRYSTLLAKYRPIIDAQIPYIPNGFALFFSVRMTYMYDFTCCRAGNIEASDNAKRGNLCRV